MTRNARLTSVIARGSGTSYLVMAKNALNSSTSISTPAGQVISQESIIGGGMACSTALTGAQKTKSMAITPNKEAWRNCDFIEMRPQMWVESKRRRDSCVA